MCHLDMTVMFNKALKNVKLQELFYLLISSMSFVTVNSNWIAKVFLQIPLTNAMMELVAEMKMSVLLIMSARLGPTYAPIFPAPVCKLEGYLSVTTKK